MPKEENVGEVNQESETLVPEEIEDDTNDDDEVVPPLEEKDISRQIEELDSPSEPSPDDIEETEEEDQEEVPEDPQAHTQPKPVEGETPREKALRLEIQKLRQKVRNKDNIIQASPANLTDEEYDQLKQIYSDDELEKVEKLFEVIGRRKGYVKASELYQQAGNETLKSWIDEHPEYKIENDIDDIRWNTFKGILEADYKLAGKSTVELKRIFNKVHRDVLEQFGESPSKVIKPLNRKAQIQKVRSASHTGSLKVTPTKKSNAPTDPTVRAMFKGFDDDDF